MVNKDRHPTSPRLPVQTLPQACPPALGAFYCGMRVATAGLLGLCLPARRARSEMQADRRGVEQLGDVGVDVPDLVTNSAGTLLIPVPISPPKMEGIEPFVRWGTARLGGSCHAWGDARPDRALGCVDCDARFARARYRYQPRAVRALRLVVHSANELPVRLTG
jgi:hypothetical protein